MSHLFFLQFYRSDGKLGKLGFFITAVLGIYTHYFFIFLLITQALFLIYHYIRKRRLQPHLARFHTRFVMSYVGLKMVVLLFLPWLIYVVQLGLAANTQPLIPLPTSFSRLQVYLNFLIGFQSQPVLSLILSLWPLLLMALFFIFTRKLSVSLERIDYFVIVSFVPVILVFLFSFIKPIFLPRYLIIVVPTLFTLLGWVFVNINQRAISVVTMSMLLIMPFSLNIQDTSHASPVQEDYKDVVDYIMAEASPHDIVAVSAPFTVYPIEYYYSGLARIDTIPHWNRYIQGPIPPFTQATLETQINNYAQIYNRVFVVLSYDQGYQALLVDYMDHHYQLLTDKQFAANINVRVYQLRYDTKAQQILQN